MKSRDSAAVHKMIQYCKDIELLLCRFGRNKETYKTDISFQYSCNMCIIQIGELVNRLSDEFLEAHADIPWHAIKGMRNLHAHDYENVDLEIVWNTLIEDIPELRIKLERMSV